MKDKIQETFMYGHEGEQGLPLRHPQGSVKERAKTGTISEAIEHFGCRSGVHNSNDHAVRDVLIEFERQRGRA